MLKALLFDMDGTLVDTERYYTKGTYKWMKRYGYKGPLEALYPIIGTSMEETARIINTLLKNDWTIEKTIKINDDYFNLEEIIDYRKYIFPEVKKNLKRFKELGFKLALCSASYRRDIDRFLKENDLIEVFDFSLSAYECKTHKPDPTIYLEALRYFGVKKEEAWIIEDSYSGIMAGKNAQIYTLARQDERFGIDQTMADRIIRDLDELYELLLKEKMK